METICYFIRNFNKKNIVSFWKIIVVHIVHSSRVACFKLKNYLYILFTTIFFIWPCDKIGTSHKVEVKRLKRFPAFPRHTTNF
jgi:hypothetical protein